MGNDVRLYFLERENVTAWISPQSTISNQGRVWGYDGEGRLSVVAASGIALNEGQFDDKLDGNAGNVQEAFETIDAFSLSGTLPNVTFPGLPDEVPIYRQPGSDDDFDNTEASFYVYRGNSKLSRRINGDPTSSEFKMVVTIPVDGVTNPYVFPAVSYLSLIHISEPTRPY